MKNLLDLLQLGAYTVIGVLILAVYMGIHDLITSHNDRELMKDGKVAPALNRGGAYFGLFLAMTGSLVMSKASFEDNLRMFVADGVIAVVVFLLAHFLIDLVVLRRVNNQDEVGRGNLAVAILEALTYIGLGLLIGAAFSGDGDQSFWAGVGNAAAFSGIGLATLMVIYMVYDAAWKAVYKFWIDKAIAADNRAAALDAGSLLLSMSIVLWFAIAGDHEDSFGQDFQSFADAGIKGVVILTVVRVLALLILAIGVGRSSRGTHHRNMAKSLVLAGVSLGAASVTGLAIFFA